jgi:hypothetical protein
VPEANQPRNRYGIRVTKSGKSPRDFWYPSARARDDMWQGFLKEEPGSLLEAVGVK